MLRFFLDRDGIHIVVKLNNTKTFWVLNLITKDCSTFFLSFSTLKHGRKTIAMENEEDIPYFRDLSMENIEVTGCRQFTKIEPLQGRPETIRNVVVNGQKLV